MEHEKIVAVFTTRGAQIPDARSPSRLNFEGWRLIFVRIQCHPSGAHYFEVPHRLLKTCAPMFVTVYHWTPSWARRIHHNLFIQHLRMWNFPIKILYVVSTMRSTHPASETSVSTYKLYGITTPTDLIFNILVILQFYERKAHTFNWLSV